PWRICFPETEQTLVLRLVIPVVEEDGQQTKRVDLSARRTARGGSDFPELVPFPPSLLRRLDAAAFDRALDHGGLELLVRLVVEIRKTDVDRPTLVQALQSGKRIGRTAVAAHAIDDVHAV